MLSFQAPETALRPAAIGALEDLKKSTTSHEKLQGRLARAVQFITETSTQINDRGLEERVRYNRKHSKRIANGDLDDNDEDKEEHQNYQSKVEDLTKKMDISIRRVIDNQVWLGDVPNTLNHVKHKAINASRGAVSTQTTTQQTQGGMDMDEQDEEQPLVQPHPSEAPTAVLDAAFSTNQTTWLSKSLTERYSKHNDYIGWYRMVYDAKHPGDHAPPMPHASMWFAEEENRNTTAAPRGSQSRGQQKSGDNGRLSRSRDVVQSDSDSDVEIAAEKTSIKCTLTLLPFKDPVRSTKCPHAFEKSAIYETFKHATEHVPFTSEQFAELSQITRAQDRAKRERDFKTPIVRCPECSAALTENDFRPDPVLLRKVNRVLEKERRAEEAEQRQGDDIIDADEDDDDDDDGPPRGTQRRTIVHVGSSPARSVRRESQRIIKGERNADGIRH